MSEAVFEILEWDSSFFGLKIAKAKSARFASEERDIVSMARNAGVRCLYFLIDPESSDSLTAMRDFGCKYVDGRLTLNNHLSVDSSEARSGAKTRKAESGDFDALVEIAYSTHWETRFFMDSRFSRERCRDLYVEWITKDLRNDNVLVAVEKDNAPSGFLSYGIDGDSKRAEICLIAVREQFRGRGIADTMMASVLSSFNDRGIESVHVVTQVSNIPAQRLYQKHGFLSHSLNLWFHLWLD